MASEVDPLYPQNVWFSLGKTKESRNLCYHGTGSEEGAREAARGQQQGTSMPERYNRGDGQ